MMDGVSFRACFGGGVEHGSPLSSRCTCQPGCLPVHVTLVKPPLVHPAASVPTVDTWLYLRQVPYLVPGMLPRLRIVCSYTLIPFARYL